MLMHTVLSYKIYYIHIGFLYQYIITMEIE